MAELLDRIKESTGFRAIAVVGALAWLFGMLLLAYGLARARAAPAWMAGGIAVAAIIVFAGQVSDNRIIFAVAFAIYLASLGLLGGRILAESDEAWEGERAHAPLPTRPTVAS